MTIFADHIQKPLGFLQWFGFYYYKNPDSEDANSVEFEFEKRRQRGMLIDITVFIMLLLLRYICTGDIEELISVESIKTKSGDSQGTRFQDKMSNFMLLAFQNICGFVKNIMRLILLIVFFFISIEKSDLLHLCYLCVVISMLLTSNENINRVLVFTLLCYTSLAIISKRFENQVYFHLDLTRYIWVSLPKLRAPFNSRHLHFLPEQTGVEHLLGRGHRHKDAERVRAARVLRALPGLHGVRVRAEHELHFQAAAHADQLPLERTDELELHADHRLVHQE